MVTRTYLGILINAPCFTHEERVTFLLDSLMAYSWHRVLENDSELRDALIDLENAYEKAHKALFKRGYKI